MGEREIDDGVRLPFLRAWSRTRSAIVFHLSNGTLQVMALSLSLSLIYIYIYMYVYYVFMYIVCVCNMNWYNMRYRGGMGRREGREELSTCTFS